MEFTIKCSGKEFLLSFKAKQVLPVLLTPKISSSSIFLRKKKDRNTIFHLESGA